MTTVYNYDNKVGKNYIRPLEEGKKEINFSSFDCGSYKIVEADSLEKLVECVCIIMQQKGMIPIGGITVIDNPHHSRVYVQALYYKAD